MTARNQTTLSRWKSSENTSFSQKSNYICRNALSFSVKCGGERTSPTLKHAFTEFSINFFHEVNQHSAYLCRISSMAVSLSPSSRASGRISFCRNCFDRNRKAVRSELCSSALSESELFSSADCCARARSPCVQQTYSFARLLTETKGTNLSRARKISCGYDQISPEISRFRSQTRVGRECWWVDTARICPATSTRRSC